MLASTRRSALAVFGLTLMTACAEGGPAPEAASRSEVTAFVATYPDGHTETTYLNVPRAEAAPAQELTLADGGAKPSRRMMVVLVDTGKGMGGITAAQVESAMFSGPGSANAYYRESSYGIEGLTGKVLGPLAYKMDGCDPVGMAQAIKMQVPGPFDQIAYVFAPNDQCAWAGLASVGTASRPSQDTWFNGMPACVTAVQEPGHNYGLQHSSSLTCGTATLNDDLSTCKHVEYGDAFDPMGGGCRHMNVWQKEYQGWLRGCNSVKVTSSGTFNLMPTELACDGIQALQIPFPKTRKLTRPAGYGGAGTDDVTSYYLEYRTSVGFDKGMTPTVLLHIGGEYRTGAEGGLHTWLLDAHPKGAAGIGDAGFKAGETFTDPAGGVSFTIEALDTEKATVRVEIANGSGAPTCLDGSTLTAPGPTTCSGIVGDADAGAGSDPTTDPGDGGAGSAGDGVPGLPGVPSGGAAGADASASGEAPGASAGAPNGAAPAVEEGVTGGCSASSHEASPPWGLAMLLGLLGLALAARKRR